MKVFAVFALTFTLPIAMVAQSSVHLEGRVIIGSTQKSAPNAQVIVADTTANTTNVSYANHRGKYAMDFVPKKGDSYTVSAKSGNLTSAPRPLDIKHVPDQLNFSVGVPNTPPVNEPASYTFPTNVLQSGTPVKLVLQENLSSADAQSGQQVAFRVLDDVIVNGHLLIAHGALAKGTVTEARAKRRLGRAGKLNVSINYVLMTDGQHAALSAVKDSKGNGRGAAVTIGVTATAIVFFPAAPLFLLMHGKDVKIPEGTIVTAFTNGDIPFDPSKFSIVKSEN